MHTPPARPPAGRWHRRGALQPPRRLLIRPSASLARQLTFPQRTARCDTVPPLLPPPFPLRWLSCSDPPGTFVLPGAMQAFFYRPTLAVVPLPPHPYGGRRLNRPAAGAPIHSLPPRRNEPAQGYTYLSGSHVTSPPVSTARPNDRPLLQGAPYLTRGIAHAPPPYDAAAAARVVGAATAIPQPACGWAGMAARAPAQPVNSAALPGLAGNSGHVGAAGGEASWATACVGGSLSAGVPPPVSTRRNISPAGEVRGVSDDDILHVAQRRPGMPRPPPVAVSTRPISGRRSRPAPSRASPSPSPTRQWRSSPPALERTAAGAALARGSAVGASAACALAPPTELVAFQADISELSRVHRESVAGLRRDATVLRKEVVLTNNNIRELVKKTNDIATVADQLAVAFSHNRRLLTKIEAQLTSVVAERATSRDSAAAAAGVVNDASAPAPTSSIITVPPPRTQEEMEKQDAAWVIVLKPVLYS